MTPERMDEIRAHLNRVVRWDNTNLMIKELVHALDAAYHSRGMLESEHAALMEEKYRLERIVKSPAQALPGPTSPGIAATSVVGDGGSGQRTTRGVRDRTVNARTRDQIKQIEADLDLVVLRGRRALSRRLVDHPWFELVQGMLVRFREDDGTWMTRRFRDFNDFPLHFPLHKERFDLDLDDYATVAILIRLYLEQGGNRRAECSRSADRQDKWYIGWKDSPRRDYKLRNRLVNDVGVAAARALLAVWERKSRG
jgi:hypothetical protein